MDMDEDNDNDDETTSLSSFISIGTAEMKPMTPVNPPLPTHENEGNTFPFSTTATATATETAPTTTAISATEATGPTTTTTITRSQDPTLAELIDMHRRRHILPQISIPSSPAAVQASEPGPTLLSQLQGSERSLDTMCHLKEKRRDSDEVEVEVGIEANEVQIEDESVNQKREYENETQNQNQTHNQNRRSIIDPSTVKVSFLGTMSEPGVAALPLEQGLQKLYKLYQE